METELPLLEDRHLDVERKKSEETVAEIKAFAEIKA